MLRQIHILIRFLSNKIFVCKLMTKKDINANIHTQLILSFTTEGKSLKKKKKKPYWYLSITSSHPFLI